MCLQDWLRHWPLQQLLILRYEDYVAATSEHISAVLRFLDVPEPDPAVLVRMVGAEVQNKKSYPPMQSRTRHLLEAFYRPFSAALAAALGDNRWLWNDTASVRQAGDATAAQQHTA